jgi:sugar lactone lactonase YvrE
VTRWLARLAAGLLVLGLVVITVVKLRYGGGASFPERVAPGPLMPIEALQVVAELPSPPGNVAVSPEGRVFVTLHPEAHPAWSVVELVDGSMQPFPSLAFQTGEREPRAFRNVLSLRVDQQNRLWTLDNGDHGLHPGRLLAFSLANGAVVHEYRVPRSLAGLGSHLNDFQVSADGRYVFIADASFFAQNPALIVYDTQQRRARRVLEGHVSMMAEQFTPRVQGRRMEVLGLVSIRPGVDSIVLSRDGHWLYFGAVTAQSLYRVQVADLLDTRLTSTALAERVQRFAPKPVTDGLSSDDLGRLYLSDPEHSRIVQMQPDGSLLTLIQGDALRWPDGFSFGPDGDLYIACSALHQVLGRLPWQIHAAGPFPLYRLPLGVPATPGH